MLFYRILIMKSTFKLEWFRILEPELWSVELFFSKCRVGLWSLKKHTEKSQREYAWVVYGTILLALESRSCHSKCLSWFILLEPLVLFDSCVGTLLVSASEMFLFLSAALRGRRNQWQLASLWVQEHHHSVPFCWGMWHLSQREVSQLPWDECDQHQHSVQPGQPLPFNTGPLPTRTQGQPLPSFASSLHMKAFAESLSISSSHINSSGDVSCFYFFMFCLCPPWF